ncbi:MAG: InlB B-repeat-containing protein, partial [Clostridiales Family XIII bacterium]|nr:InlB B-repeat-containing protein [Clostridiales Family XIII bacterium]
WLVTSPAGDAKVYQAGGAVKVAAATTLTAQWKARFAVTYALNGGAAGTAGDAFAPANVLAGSHTLPSAKPSKGGSDADFAGWLVTSPAGDAKVYQAGGAVKVAGATTLTAQWKARFAVTYALNGGSAGTAGDAFAPANVLAGDHALPSAKPAKDGSDADFEGWIVTSPAGDTKVYKPGAAVQIAAATTLTAQWKARFAVTYVLNGGAAGAAADAFAPANVLAGSHALPSAKPVKDGSDADFSGWKITVPAGNANVYKAGDAVKVTGATTLTAQWKEHFTLAYDLAGGAAGDAFATANVHAGSYTISSKKPVKDGSDADFSGWKITAPAGPAGAGRVYSPGGAITISANTTLTAQWGGGYSNAKIPKRDATDRNILVKNKGVNPLVNYNFIMRVEAAFDLPCKSVKAFTRENEYELIQEGGLNDYVHMRRKPISKPFTLEVERYVGVDYLDPLPNGTELLLPIIIIISRHPDQFGDVSAWARNYAFTGCTVIKKTYGELNAEQSGLLVDTTTIAYREMICLDLPYGA